VVASFHSHSSLRDFLLKEGVFLYASSSISYISADFDTFRGAALSVLPSAYGFVLQMLRRVISNQLESGAKFVRAIVPAIRIGSLEAYRDAAAVTVLRRHIGSPRRSLGSGLRAINPE
jgi:hypothetical protein